MVRVLPGAVMTAQTLEAQGVYVKMTRQAAIAAGATRYYTGKACKRGHIAERFVSSGGCTACHYQPRKSTNMLTIFRSVGMEPFTHWYHPADAALVEALVLSLQNDRLRVMQPPITPQPAPTDKAEAKAKAEQDAAWYAMAVRDGMIPTVPGTCKHGHPLEPQTCPNCYPAPTA